MASGQMTANKSRTYDCTVQRGSNLAKNTLPIGPFHICVRANFEVQMTVEAAHWTYYWVLMISLDFDREGSFDGVEAGGWSRG